MFEILDEFSIQPIDNIIESRKNLGSEMPVFVYRLFQNTIKNNLIKKYGPIETNSVFKEAGYLAGTQFAEKMLNLNLPFNEFVADLQNALQDFKMGILKIEKYDDKTGALTLTIAEDLDCSGLPITGETVCNYDEGFLEGVLSLYTKCDYLVKEVDCWSTGSLVCRFEAWVK